MNENNVIVNSSELFVLNEEIIHNLKIIASRHPLKRARVCLHESLDNKVHEMIIVAHKDGIIPPHSHPIDKPESYHVIEGVLQVSIFNTFLHSSQSINFQFRKLIKSLILFFNLRIINLRIINL